MVVIDIERERDGAEERRSLSHPLRVRAVEGNEDALAAVVGKLAANVADRQESVLGRRIGVAAEHHDGVLAEGVERKLQAEDRSDRVAVRVLVRDEEEAVVLTQGGRYGDEISGRLGRGHRSTLTSARPRRRWGRTRTSASACA